jgi:hypothetical protein
MKKSLNTFALSLIATSCAFAFCLASASAAEVDTNYAPLTTLPGVFTAGTPTNPVAVLKGIYGLAIGIGSVIAVVMIIFAGFKYMYVESMNGKSDAKEQIQNAILGLLVILGSYIILRTINPDLVDFDITLNGGRGRVAGLTAYQVALDQIRRENAIASRELGTELRRGEALQAQVRGIERTQASLQADIEEAREQHGDNSPEVRALLSQMEELEAQKNRLNTQAQTIISAAQERAAQAARASITRQTEAMIKTGSIADVETKLAGYERALTTEIAAINANSSLTPEQKASRIAQAREKTTTDEYLSRQQIRAIQGASDPETLRQIETDIRNKYIQVTNPQTTNLTAADRARISQEYLATQRSIATIAAAQNERDAAKRGNIIKCAILGMANPGLGLSCIF